MEIVAIFFTAIAILMIADHREKMVKLSQKELDEDAK